MPPLYPYLRTLLIIKRKQISNYISTNKDRNFAPFIILCEPRTGSTLLHTYLNSHPQVWSYGEILREHLEGKTSAPLPPLDELVFRPHASRIKSVGLKLFYYYYTDPDYAPSFREILKRKEIKIIHLTRKDRLRQFVSLKMAEKFKTWSTTRKSKDHGKIRVNVQGLKVFVQKSKRQEQKFNLLFKQHKILHITYEELSQNPPEVLHQVQDFLGVKPRKLFSLIKKQNPQDLERVVENYGEVKGFL